ncbi:PREDICTED: glutamic acid-rich protein-like isoform X1 [Wasmannia auropunctata]|uniref:glutamic acid-rich protein-like isoform X1 n=2 Tax=Wasmannia auropunctata TaxID=64793 RepID=UPI0005EED3D0|nr:PREDICTED: glutamic acid-rich protein-like isoform X1 [Wasmannia auropunctata]
MKNRLHHYICIFVVLEILQSSICYAKTISDTRRTKRELSIAETSQLEGDANHAKEINLEHEEESDNDDLEKDGMHQDDTKKERKISRKAANAVISADLHPSNAEESFDLDNASNSQHSNEGSEGTEEEDEEAINRERDKNEEASNLVRLPRGVNGDFNRYTDQDERSSLYDDYEAKDVAKRGVLSGSKDYEEVEDDSPGIEDMAAVQESTNEAENGETPKDARVKRDQAEISEMVDKSKSSLDDSAVLEESKTAAKNPYSRDVSHIESSKSINEAPASSDKDFESKDVISKLSDSSKIQEPASIVASSKRDESNAEYEKRVEEEIQRKIDSIKEEIQRDIETQQRIRDIEDNNARFDELQNQENEDEERQIFQGEPIKKRQTTDPRAKRSVRESADDAIASLQRNDKKRSLKRDQHKKRQHRSGKIDKLDSSKENENLNRIVVANHKSSEQIPLKEFSKTKRERVRQVFLVNNDQRQKRRRQLRSYTLPSDRTAENELFMNPDLNSYLRPNKMLKASSLVGSDDENNEEEQSPTAEHSDSLLSLTGSSQELNPRLEKEYKEAFGGLQSEPGNALARFKRVKRVLTNGPNAKIKNFGKV